MELKVMESVQSPLGSYLDSCQSSMARKLPGGQQVATGVLVGEAEVETRSSADTNTTKGSIVSGAWVPSQTQQYCPTFPCRQSK